MSYRSYVGAAIGGKPHEIEDFVLLIKAAQIPDEAEILPEFKIIQLESDFSVFVFYGEYIRWYEDEACETWQHLIMLADKAKLSWVFKRTGEDYTDAEESDNWSSGVDFDNRMHSLFTIDHLVSVADPKLVAAERIAREAVEQDKR